MKSLCTLFICISTQLWVAVRVISVLFVEELSVLQALLVAIFSSIQRTDCQTVPYVGLASQTPTTLTGKFFTQDMIY